MLQSHADSDDVMDESSSLSGERSAGYESGAPAPFETGVAAEVSTGKTYDSTGVCTCGERFGARLGDAAFSKASGRSEMELVREGRSPDLKSDDRADWSWGHRHANYSESEPSEVSLSTETEETLKSKGAAASSDTGIGSSREDVTIGTSKEGFPNGHIYDSDVSGSASVGADSRKDYRSEPSRTIDSSGSLGADVPVGSPPEASDYIASDNELLRTVSRSNDLSVSGTEDNSSSSTAQGTAASSEIGRGDSASDIGVDASVSSSAPIDAQGSTDIQASAAIPASASDRELASRIKRDLTSESADLTTTQAFTSENLRNVQIKSVNGMVTLQGSVRSDMEKQNLESRVKAMKGVSEVNNQIRVVPSLGTQLPDLGNESYSVPAETVTPKAE